MKLLNYIQKDILYWKRDGYRCCFQHFHPSFQPSPLLSKRPNEWMGGIEMSRSERDIQNFIASRRKGEKRGGGKS